MECRGCSPGFLRLIKDVSHEEDVAFEIFRSHGFIPCSKKCLLVEVAAYMKARQVSGGVKQSPMMDTCVPLLWVRSEELGLRGVMSN